MTIKNDNCIITLSITDLKDYLINAHPLIGGRHLMNDKHQVSVFYDTSTKKYLLSDPNNLTTTQSFSADKIDELIKQISCALGYKINETIQPISIHMLDIPTPTTKFVRIRKK